MNTDAQLDLECSVAEMERSDQEAMRWYFAQVAKGTDVSRHRPQERAAKTRRENGREE